MKFRRSNNFVFSLLALMAFSGLGSSVLATERDGDQILIQAPTNLQSISGNVQISWFMKDIEQQNIPIQIDLFTNTCPNNGDYYGTITDSGLVSILGNNKSFTYQWNSQGAIKNKSTVPDGQYCMRVCGVFVRDTNYYYSLCDTKSVNLTNNNHAPQILSKLTKLNYQVNDEFAYQVNATDPDGDTVIYKLMDAPSFITINQNTGLVKSIGKLQTNGSYTIRVRVEDPLGAFSEEVATFNVGTNGLTINITAPKDNDVVKNNPVQIIWTISDIKIVKAFNIYYSQDIKSWNKIATIAVTKYDWDITNVASGNYYIKVEVEDQTGGKSSATTGVFSVDHSSGGSTLLISNLQPIDGAVISVRKPDISANYSSSDNKRFLQELTDLYLDDSLVSGCVKTDNSITCRPKDDLGVGKHKVRLVVVDESKRSNQKEWYFEVTDNTIATSSGGINGLDSEQIKQILTIIGIGVAVCIVPWLIYSFIKRVITKKEDTMSTETNYTDYQLQPMQIQTDYSVPTVGNYDYQPLPALPDQSVTVPTDVSTGASGTIQMPSSYNSDEIPDWLRDNSSGASTPVASSEDGKDGTYFGGSTNASMDDISRPHE